MPAKPIRKGQYLIYPDETLTPNMPFPHKAVTKQMKRDYARSQATRRKTLFPLSVQAVAKHRALVAYDLHHNIKLPIYAVRQVMKCSPEEARRYIAKAQRMKRELLAEKAQANRCTCPAHYDHTFMGHLPDCPTHNR